jgi:prevent-host-death family protein
VKLIGLKEAKARLSAFVEQAQRDRILITRHGKPAALVIGVEGQDLEQILLGSDAEFWAMIRERRRRAATLSSDDVRRSFGIRPASEKHSGGVKSRRRAGRKPRGR